MSDPREYLKLKYIGDCKCGNCQLVPPEMLARWADEIMQLRAQAERLTTCAKFVVWAVNEGPWQGGDLDGLSVQEKAEELGLIAETKFDPAIHKASDWVAPEPGDPWFTLHPDIVALSSTNGEASNG